MGGVEERDVTGLILGTCTRFETHLELLMGRLGEVELTDVERRLVADAASQVRTAADRLVRAIDVTAARQE
uniref:hypothetical protein n=1 Tax=Sphaerisporangium sp. CA-236357 TaxID=3240030 RepID=UPI003F492BF4